MSEGYAKKQGYKPIKVELYEAKGYAECCKYCGYPYLVKHYDENGNFIKALCMRCRKEERGNK